jgi:hypothetical protein
VQFTPRGMTLVERKMRMKILNRNSLEDLPASLPERKGRRNGLGQESSAPMVGSSL